MMRTVKYVEFWEILMNISQKEYDHIHWWLRVNYTKPNNCEECGEVRKLDWANISDDYHKDIKDFKALCRTCHRYFDGWGKKEYCNYGHKLEGDNLHIRSNGWRTCQECRRAAALRYYYRKKRVLQ